MGRPPNSSFSCHSPTTRPWAPPVNLAGGLLRGSVTPHVNKVRQFVLPIPAVPAHTAKAIRTALAGTIQPFAAQQNRIRSLTAKLQDQREKAAASQQRKADLETLKEQGLRDIRETRQQETANIVATLERKLRIRYNKEAAAAQAVWKAQLDEECEAKRKAWRLARQEAVDSGEPDKKRMKLLEAAAGDSEEPTDAAILAIIQPAAAAVEIKSDGLREQVVEAEAALEKLIESRTEMIWLLKQVIKADEKQKSDNSKKPAAARIESSRQA